MSSRPSYQPKNSTFLERLKEELDVNDITPELTAENYKEKFHKLLCWEEMQHITILHERFVSMHISMCFRSGIER